MAAGIIGDICLPAPLATADPKDSASAQWKSTAREVLSGVGLTQLATLAELLEGAGRFSIALEVYEWLESVDPVASHIRIARLIERVGHAGEGVKVLLGSTARRWKKQSSAAVKHLLPAPSTALA